VDSELDFDQGFLVRFPSWAKTVPFRTVSSPVAGQLAGQLAGRRSARRSPVSSPVGDHNVKIWTHKVTFLMGLMGASRKSPNDITLVSRVEDSIGHILQTADTRWDSCRVSAYP